MNHKKLTPEAQDLADEYELMVGDGCCSCSASSMPPCSYCENVGTHPGHPEALADDPTAWENRVESAMRVENNE